MSITKWNDGSGYEYNGYANTAFKNGKQVSLDEYNNYLQSRNSANSGAGLVAAGNSAAALADPWASQRGQYQTSLSQLMQNPGSAMQNNPIFKWQQQQGEQAVARQAAAQGQNYSGNKMMALSDYAQKQSGNNFFQLADLYSLLGGAKSQNPGGAAQLAYQGNRDYVTANQNKMALDQGAYQYQNNFNYNKSLNDLTEQGIQRGYGGSNGYPGSVMY